MDRFDLETAITNLYNVVDDLNDISYNIEQDLIEQEEVSNSIDSVAVGLKLKVNKLFDVFTQVFQLDQYNPRYHEYGCGCEDTSEIDPTSYYV